jgi:hypothetical protein
MHRRWQDYVDHIDIGVVGDAVEVLIVVNILIRNIVFSLPRLCLGGGTRYDAGEITVSLKDPSASFTKSVPPRPDGPKLTLTLSAVGATIRNRA